MAHVGYKYQMHLAWLQSILLCLRYVVKRYPKEFQQETVIQADGHSLYRQQNNGYIHTVPLRGSTISESFDFDNRWVVPYNPYLTWRY